MITGQNLLDLLGKEPWSGFNKDDMKWDVEESYSAKRCLNRAIRYLLTLRDFPFRGKEYSLESDRGTDLYKMVDGQITKIYEVDTFKELQFIGDNTEYDKTKQGKPTHYWIEQGNPKQQIRLYPIPDASYQYNVAYNSFQPVVDKDGKTKKYKFDNADDYLNIPPNLEDVFADCVVLRAIVTNNKDEQDENYRPTIDEFNEHWGVFKAMANPTKTVKRVVI